MVNEFAKNAVKELGVGAMSSGAMRGDKFRKLVTKVNNMIQDGDDLSKVQFVRKLAEDALHRELSKRLPAGAAAAASQKGSFFDESDGAERKLNMKVSQLWKKGDPALMARIKVLAKQQKDAQGEVAVLRQSTLSDLARASSFEEKAAIEQKEVTTLKQLTYATKEEQQRIQQARATAKALFDGDTDSAGVVASSVSLLDVSASQPTAQLEEMETMVNEFAKNAVKELGVGAMSSGAMRGDKFRKLVTKVNNMIQDGDDLSKVQFVRKLAEDALHRELSKRLPAGAAAAASQKGSFFDESDGAERKLNMKVSQLWKKGDPALMARIKVLAKQQKDAQGEVAVLRQSTLSDLARASSFEEKAAIEQKEVTTLKQLKYATKEEQQRIQQARATAATHLVQHLRSSALQKKAMKADKIATLRKLRVLRVKARSAIEAEENAAEVMDVADTSLLKAQRSQGKTLQPKIEQLATAIEQNAKKQSRSSQVKSQAIVDEFSQKAGAARAEIAQEESEMHLRLQKATQQHDDKEASRQREQQAALNAAAKVRGLTKQLSTLGIETSSANRRLKSLRRSSKMFDTQACKLKTPQSALCETNAQLYVKQHEAHRLTTLKQKRVALHSAKMHQNQLRDAIQKLKAVKAIARKVKQEFVDDVHNNAKNTLTNHTLTNH